MIPQVDPPWKWGVYTGKGVAEPPKPRTREGGEVNPDWTCEERGNGVVLSSFSKGNPTEKQTG
jgi:hypothetical protein